MNTDITKAINSLSNTARAELLNFHIQNGHAQIFMINGVENIRLALPTGEVALVKA